MGFNSAFKGLTNPPKERNRMVLDPVNGVAKGECGCLLCSTSDPDPTLLKNTIEKHSYIPAKMGCRGGGASYSCRM